MLGWGCPSSLPWSLPISLCSGHSFRDQSLVPMWSGLLSASRPPHRLQLFPEGFSFVKVPAMGTFSRKSALGEFNFPSIFCHFGVFIYKMGIIIMRHHRIIVRINEQVLVKCRVSCVVLFQS